jgi:hypothetical protein
VSDKPFSVTHPELFHYTDQGGLLGILQSQCLRATHWQHLDDTQELIHLRETLVELVQPALLLVTSRRTQNNLEFRQWVAESGGEGDFAKKLGQELTDLLYKTLMNDDPQSQIFDFFITSFCTPPGNSERVREHGLLSQWRSYGRNGGYAIVFDTAGLETLMRSEAVPGSGRLSMGDVGYSSDAREVLFQRLEALPQLETALVNFAAQRTVESSKALLRPLLECMTRLKHWAFSEEHEVRLVAILDGKAMQSDPGVTGFPESESRRSSFTRCGVSIPCVHLFDGIKTDSALKLPIRRIIIGPGSKQNDREAMLKDLLQQQGYAIPITRSGIPLRY